MIGARLRELRAKAELSQEELAKHLQMARTTLAMYETDRREPDYTTLKRIADYFQVSTDYLLGRTDDPRGSQPEDEEREKELDKLLADEEIHLNGEPLTIEEKEALLAVIKMIKRNKVAKLQAKKQDNTPK